MNANEYHVFDGKVVKILTCSNCNVNCKHCYISFNGNFSKEKLDEIVDKLSQKFEVIINGSEPLLHREYLDCFKKTKQELVLTNGLVFKDNYDYIDELKNYGITRIGISYHFDFHDDVSPVKKEYLDKLFKIIIDKGLDVQIMTTITSQNYRKIEEYCKYCEDMGIRFIRFTNLIVQGRASELDKKLIMSYDDLNEFFSIIDKMRTIYSKEKLKIMRCGSFGKNENSEKEFICGGGINSVVLTPNLNVYPCLFFSKPGNEIGYYEDGNIYINNQFSQEQNDCTAIKVLNRIRKF